MVYWTPATRRLTPVAWSRASVVSAMTAPGRTTRVKSWPGAMRPPHTGHRRNWPLAGGPSTATAASGGACLPPVTFSRSRGARWTPRASCAEFGSSPATAPLSPRTLRNSLERITGRTLEGCSQGLYRSKDIHQLYEAQISRIVCLLANFIDYSTPIANVNFYMLNKAIQYERRRTYSQHADQLLRVLQLCDYCDNPREFVECWANEGVLSCAYQEANQLADQLPASCAISVSR